MTEAGPQHPMRAVADLVAVMDRLRSPGGCPWDAEQTHASLVRYALEEAYEVAEAIEDGDRAALREELGDLLLQVVFHARIATEHPTDPFDVDDVAAGIAAKLRRRHPHVFDPPAPASPDDVSVAEHTPGGSATDTSGRAGTSGGEVIDAAEVRARWDRIKLAEDGRTSVFDGVPAAMPALARAQKVLGRARRAGLVPQDGSDVVVPVDEGDDGLPVDASDVVGPAGSDDDASAGLGRELLALVERAEALGLDAEQALRTTVRSWETALRSRERASTG